MERRANLSGPDLGKQNMKDKRQRMSSEKSSERSRRSGRRLGGNNVGKEEVIEKMVTRSLIRRHKVVRGCDSDSEDSGESVAIMSKNVGKIEKRFTRCSAKTDMEKED